MTPRTPNQMAQTLSERLQPGAVALSNYLETPSFQADADLTKTFETLGKHPLLSVGSIGGLLGLFGYAKAIGELTKLAWNADALITASDTGDFAVRLAVPFLLLALMLAGVQLTWMFAMGKVDKPPAKFWGLSGIGIALIVLSFGGVLAWAPQDPDYLSATVSTRWTQFGVFLALAAAVVLLIPPMRLRHTFQKYGAVHADRFQRKLNKHLSAATSPLGLFAALLFLGVMLLLTPRFSVLFPQKHSWQAGAKETSVVLGVGIAHADETRAGEEASGNRILENSNAGTALEISPTIARIGSMLLVNVVNPNDPNTSLLMLPSSNVGCIRPKKPGEQPTTTCVRPATTPPTSTAPAPNISIATFANKALGCNIASFDRGRLAVVASFVFDEPVAGAKGDDLTKEQWGVLSSAFGIGGLAGIDRTEDSPSGITAATALLQQLAQDASSTIWVLGFASAAGDPDRNLALSERRAAALEKFLLAKYGGNRDSIAERIRTRPMGETSLADLFGVDKAEGDQLAVAFYCN